MFQNILHRLLIAATLAGVVLPSPAQDAMPSADGVAYAHAAPQFSPYAGRAFPTRVLFGDTHLHTAVSVDAGTMNRLGQEDAFRFARG